MYASNALSFRSAVEAIGIKVNTIEAARSICRIINESMERANDETIKANDLIYISTGNSQVCYISISICEVELTRRKMSIESKICDYAVIV